MKNGKQILSDFFDAFNIEYVFGNPGTTETTFLDVMLSNKKCKYILGLHESTATGVAAGYAVSSGKTSILNIHTYPGLANSMSNLYNSYTSGIPVFVIAGQQNRQHLIHQPILSGNLIELAKTSTIMQYEIRDISEMHIALQRCYLEATDAKAPTFLSIPMEIYTDEYDSSYFKPTKLLTDTKVRDLSEIINIIKNHDGKKIAFVVDAEAVWSVEIKTLLLELVRRLDSAVYLAPFALKTSISQNTPNYHGVLPSTSNQANKVLSDYEVIILLGEKIQAFLFEDKQIMPSNPIVIQISSGNTKSRFDFPFDYVVRGNIGSNLAEILAAFKQQKVIAQDNLPRNIHCKSILGKILSYLPKDYSITIEGSSHQRIEEDLTQVLSFQNTYFEPRGGSLGWAMPLAVGISLHSGKHTICLMGDGGSMYSIHSLWTAAHYKIPVVFICFINHEYKILKQLWKLQVPDTPESEYIGMDIINPQLDLDAIAKGFGAKVAHATENNYKEIIKQALSFQGPTLICVYDTRSTEKFIEI